MQLSVLLMATFVALGVAHPGFNWLQDRTGACPAGHECNTSSHTEDCCWLGDVGCCYECKEGSDAACVAEVTE
ncbi:hypothetical protein PTRG_08470 [Pyrenophora tritici-repentis Pt-1C-BFP]|uniref:Uncharacterized protein n=1 Tax=Pyrenophora tritici-repentis (strain Pt-1C-BFP) TaxID=426418 RepID=B2WE97_PYRTR|nr:uncharacterized protein PTRG_08470 [Pyrenophora tritici-repentis Pt-1C-BFP]EDU51389.1 hypothetical protein PTRG_08470 [Pyrenophora tritici-repentis Pt-1C-BFP]PWO30397.1 Mus7 domain containing protein [Pyrenophora tritici-repentis]